MLDYIKEKAIPWPNYYSGKSREDGPASEWGVSSFPTQFLVDRKGNLRYIDLDSGRDEMVSKLLAEK